MIDFRPGRNLHPRDYMASLTMTPEIVLCFHMHGYPHTSTHTERVIKNRAKRSPGAFFMQLPEAKKAYAQLGRKR